MTDDRFDRELQGFLAAREPAGVSPVLRARLQAVTAESPARAGALAGRLGGAWRNAIGLAAVAAVAVALLAVLLRVDGLTIRDPGTVGTPSAVPGATGIQFVTAPGELFTPDAVAEAERRLADVYASTRVEARLVVQPEASAAQLSTPEGWPDRFDGDGDPDRDITAVVGIAPDGTPICCLTLMGDLIEQAQAAMYWRATDQPGALDDDLAAPTAEFRDVALDRFVRGIEEMAPRLGELEQEGISRDDLARTIGFVSVVGPLLLLALVTLRRRSGSAVDAVGSVDGGMEVVEVTPVAAMAVGPAATSPATTSPLVPWQGDDGQTLGPTRWPAVPAWAVRSDRTWVLISFAALAGLALLGVVDRFVPASTSVRLDGTIDGVGVTGPGPNLVPFALVGIAIAGLTLYARQGRRRRRIGILALIALVGWTTSIVLDHTHPALADTDRGWVTSDNGEVTWRGLGGLQEQVIYRLAPGDTFTFAAKIRNPGVLPLTIMGLDGVRTTEPNPYLASIVSIGWVVQPAADGPITYLSARPEDASASWPVTLDPGEELAIVIVGRGGPCAQADGTIADPPLMHVDLAYRVLGFERSTEVGLAALLSIPTKDPCTVEIPGGTVTYSTPDQ